MRVRSACVTLWDVTMWDAALVSFETTTSVNEMRLGFDVDHAFCALALLLYLANQRSSTDMWNRGLR